MFLLSCLLFYHLIHAVWCLASLTFMYSCLVSCSDWFFGSCVMFSLVVLVMCLVSHWLDCVM